MEIKRNSTIIFNEKKRGFQCVNEDLALHRILFITISPKMIEENKCEKFVFVIVSYCRITHFSTT